MTEMTMTQAVELLRELLQNEDAVQINDGARMWDATALVHETREHDDGTIHDLAVNDEGIARVRPDGTIESVRMYVVQPRPTVAGLAAELRDHGVPEQRIQGLLQRDDLRCTVCGRVLEIVESDDGTAWVACPTALEGHTDYRIEW